MVFEILGEFVVMVSGLFKLVLGRDDLAGVLKHVLLHFVEDDILSEGRVTLSSWSLSLMLVSSWVCLMLGGGRGTGWR